MPYDSDSLDTQIIEVEDPTDPNPEPIPESALQRWQALRELFRQLERNDRAPTRPDPVADDDSDA
jgi:hypothetical protein